MSENTLISKLNYNSSPFYLNREEMFESEIAHLFRSVSQRSIDVQGVYTVQVEHSSLHPTGYSRQPVVYFAEANTPQQAKTIHKKIWNLGQAPFLIVDLPDQLRLYNGFLYQENSDEGWLNKDVHTRLEQINDILQEFSALKIDSGQIWISEYAKSLDTTKRVDKRLLKNLKRLGNELTTGYNRISFDLANALIGKYVYIRYLKDREILTLEWMQQQNLNLSFEDFLGRGATVAALKKISDALDARFRGNIFPVFEQELAASLKDEHVALVASIFKGDELLKGKLRQLSLDFHAYDFQYIPVETLSAIYEQFIQDPQKKGAVYTSEFLAEYVLAELQTAKPIKIGAKILDPACGSGIFLVLAYRRLIELYLKKNQEIAPQKLREILEQSIFGVERQPDACYVTEFSLILTLLHYLEPPQLHANKDFQFPSLHNTNVFEGDFFDKEMPFHDLGLEFDWIVGNPPWITAESDKQPNAYRWIEAHKKEMPVPRHRIIDAFGWRLPELLTEDGFVGLVYHATSFFNGKKSFKNFRRKFFDRHEVHRITNFANFRDRLFYNRADVSAITIVYRSASSQREKPEIVHIAPLIADQNTYSLGEVWNLTINQEEITYVSPLEAKKGDLETWKFALWGTRLDERAIKRINRLFPKSLEQICREKGWPIPRQAPDLALSHKEKHEYQALLSELPILNTKSLNTRLKYRFSIPPYALNDNEKHYVRLQGGKAGIEVMKAPHIFVSASWQHIVFSRKSFAFQTRQIGIASPRDEDSAHLKALSLYLRSSLVLYYLFFKVPEWGLFGQSKRIIVTAVQNIPTPDLNPSQISELSDMYDSLERKERDEIQHFVERIQSQSMFSPSSFDKDFVNLEKLEKGADPAQKNLLKEFDTELRRRFSNQIDSKVYELLNIPHDIRVLAREFNEIRLKQDIPSEIISVVRPPIESELQAYAIEIRDQLDGFMRGEYVHEVVVTWSDIEIECAIRIVSGAQPVDIAVIRGDPQVSNRLSQIKASLGYPISQWAYVQRSLRVFDKNAIYIYKVSKRVYWTRTQAILDAIDIVSAFIQEGLHGSDFLST